MPLNGETQRSLLRMRGELGPEAGFGPFSAHGDDAMYGVTPEDDESKAIVPVPIRNLVRDHPHLRSPLIDGLLRVGETANLVSQSKLGKTWLVYSIALCVAIGRAIFNRFPTKKSRVLLIDNELHTSTVANRVPKVMTAMGVLMDQIGDCLDIVSLRGKLRDIRSLGTFFDTIEHGHYGLVIIDALYRSLPAGVDENDNVGIANIYNLLDSYADKLGCGFLLIHHSSKGVQSGKSVVDVGSGAGSQSRAADSHIVLRQHEDDGVAVFEAAIRSFPPVQPFCLRWDFPEWKLAPESDPTLLRSENRRKRRDEVMPAAEPEAEVWQVESFVAAFVTTTPTDKKVILATASGQGLSNRKASDFITLAESKRLIFRHDRRADKRVYFSITNPTLAESGGRS
jgi:AAA domain